MSFHNNYKSKGPDETVEWNPSLSKKKWLILPLMGCCDVYIQSKPIRVFYIYRNK